MKRTPMMVLTLLLLSVCCYGAESGEGKDGWIKLFNGETLGGWKVGQTAQSSPESLQLPRSRRPAPKTNIAAAFIFRILLSKCDTKKILFVD